MREKHDIIKIEQPPHEDKILHAFLASDPDWLSLVNKSENPSYLHWEQLKRKDFMQREDNLEIWSFIKYSRQHRARKTPVITPDTHSFTWTACPHYEEILHNFTHSLSGNMIGPAQVMNDKEKREYITRGLIEEAIASSQLEGANTTRKYAKKMIAEGLQPRDKSQRMIINNYNAMQKIEQNYKNEEMSLALLHDLHRTLTKDNTLDQGKSGQFRTDEDDIVINGPAHDGKVAFIPPDMAFVEKQIPRLINFANDSLESPFIHPVLKAIMLHFWIGYLHPYGDGNGRLARALFYWYLLRKGYWAFAFLPISEAIKKSPVQYGWAYIYSEQDDCDLTYFLDYNLKKIMQAQKSFVSYIQRKKKEREQIIAATKKIDFLNPRQVQIAHFLRSNTNESTNVSAVSTLFGVSQMTAIRDLKDMEARGLLTPARKGRNIFYSPTKKLTMLLDNL